MGAGCGTVVAVTLRASLGRLGTTGVTGPSVRARPLLRRHREPARLAETQCLDFDRAGDLVAREEADQIVRPGDSDTVERQDDIAREEARLLGRASGLDAGDHHAAVLREAGGMPEP